MSPAIGPAPQWTVCGTCFELRSPRLPGVGGDWQRCGCEPRHEQRWEGCDFPLDRELCRICGLCVLRSGSRWSVWLCDPCKSLAGQLNTATVSTVVPLGRHSLMHGIGVRGDRTHLPGELEAFTRAFRQLGSSQNRLGTWARLRVAHNLRIIGRWNQDVALRHYLEAVEHLQPEDAFYDYLNWLRGASSGNGDPDHGTDSQ